MEERQDDTVSASFFTGMIIEIFSSSFIFDLVKFTSEGNPFNEK